MENLTIQAINESINSSLNSSAVSAQSLAPFIPFTGSLVVDILLVSIMVSIVTALITKFFTEQEAIRVLKEEVKVLRKKVTETMKKDPKKAQEIQAELMKKSLQQMKHSMNPKILLLTMLPAIVVFTLLGKFYGPAGEFLNVGFTTYGWLGSYIWFSIISSIIIRKILDVA